MKELAMVSVAGIENCEEFIYRKLLQGPKSAEELARLYIQEEMQSMEYTDKEIRDISANFGLALSFLSNPRNQHKKIVFLEDAYQIAQ